ncbi:hypothetical protein FRC07_012853 [Ceratobasidium sp. 392]|nr:hypothetical protein FRC07_012853 [Ceratobasidium sp. 392]
MDLQIPTDDSHKLRVTSHHQYQSPSRLSPASVLPDPLNQFREWFKAASAPSETDQSRSVVHEPEAMAVSTCSPGGIPSTRFVLLKQADSKGFVFYTNYTSRKSKELLANPFASIAFYWREVHRQVRVVGRVEQVDGQESDEYFASRPLGSRMGAWASPQSTVVQDDEVADRLTEVEKRFDGSSGDEVPRPEFWGGWRVIPQPSTAPPRANDTLRVPKPRAHRPPNIQLLDPTNPPRLWQRSPTRQTTDELELQERSNSRSGRISRFSISSRTPSPPRAQVDKSSVLDVPSWTGDVSTFASAVIAHPEAKNSRVVKIQARKSRKLPFKHEFLLVYILIGGKTKVILRNNGWFRLGKIGGILGLRQGHRTALEEVHLFDLDHEDAEDWLYDSKRNGSQPIATLHVRGQPELPSYRAKPTSNGNAVLAESEGTPLPTLSLIDIARLLSFIQVEMPTYVLTTKNCFMMTRSILMILCSCFGDGCFICYVGDESSPEGPVSAKFLVEPLYNGIVRWYFPVVLTVLLSYMLVMFLIHWLVEVHLTGNKDDVMCKWDGQSWTDCGDHAGALDTSQDHPRGASQYGGVSFMHMLLDLPIPCAVIHWWLTKMEKEIKSVCVRLRKRIERIGLGTADVFQDSSLDNAPLEESEGSKHSVKPYLIVLGLTVGGSILLGIYWDKGLIVAIALCVIFLLMCALQGDGISADMESYVRLDTDESELNV